LHITREEQQKLSTIIDNKEYKRRDRLRAKQKYVNKLKLEGKITKKERIKILRDNIISLKKSHLKNSDISTMLKIPLKTIERHITFLKKQNLL